MGDCACLVAQLDTESGFPNPAKVLPKVTIRPSIPNGSGKTLKNFTKGIIQYNDGKSMAAYQ